MRPLGTPTDSARAAWAASMRSSPCTGMNAFGCTSASIILSSSAEPWPETCTASLSWCSTRAPRRQSAFIVSCTASSFPGTGLADMITVSPCRICTCRWSL